MTDIEDGWEYVDLGIVFWNSCPLPREDVKKILTGHMEDGVLKLPKEPDMFVAMKG